jgi:hypothetical protein
MSDDKKAKIVLGPGFQESVDELMETGTPEEIEEFQAFMDSVREILAVGPMEAFKGLQENRDFLDNACLKLDDELKQMRESEKEWYDKLQAADAHVAEAQDKVRRLEMERGAEAEALRVAFELLSDKDEISGEDVMDILDRIDAGEALAYLEERDSELAKAEARVKELEAENAALRQQIEQRKRWDAERGEDD